MAGDIVSSMEFLRSAQGEFGPFEVPAYGFRRLYSRRGQVFFDCEGDDPEACLDWALRRGVHPSFVVLLVVRDRRSGRLRTWEMSFRNPGRETLAHFISRYRAMLETMSILSLEAGGMEYVGYLGCSYRGAEA